jgi:hypothetical protein
MFFTLHNFLQLTKFLHVNLFFIIIYGMVVRVVHCFVVQSIEKLPIHDILLSLLGRNETVPLYAKAYFRYT